MFNLRRSLRYRLSTLLVIVTLLAIPLAMWARELRRYQSEQAILLKVPGAIDWHYRCPEWMIRLLGFERCEVFRTVAMLGEPTEGILIHGHYREPSMQRVDDAEFKRLVPLIALLPNLDALYLGNSQISDESMPYVAHLSGLKRVELVGANVTAEGVSRLRALRPDLHVNP